MENRPKYRSHLIPRTRDGWVAVVAFLGLLALAMPPVTHRLVNRVAPVVLGLPFLYAWLLGIHIALIVVLVWTYRKGV